MKPPPFEYHAPTSLPDALHSLGTLENALPLAGGQSLMPMLNFRLAGPDHLIDLGAIEELKFIDCAGDVIRIGAMTTQREIEFSSSIRSHLPLLAKAITEVGHRQTRNRGTIGGSLCHLDPAAELPLIATTFDAEIIVQSSRRSRTLAMSDFAVDMMTPAIEEDELVTEVRFKPWGRDHGWGFAEFARRKGDFAIVAIAVLMSLDEHQRIEQVSMGLGGVLPTPCRLPVAEQMLLGETPCKDLFEAAAALCDQEAALDDAFVPAWYRRSIAPKIAQRVLLRAWQRCGSGERSQGS